MTGPGPDHPGDGGDDVPGHSPSGRPYACTEPGCVAAAERGDRWMGPFLSLEADGRAHFHHRRALRARVDAERAVRFAAVAADYDRDPGDVAVAWAYLTGHPLFHRPSWAGHQAGSAADLTDDELRDGPIHIETDDGLRDLWVHITRDDDGALLVELEHGPHLWPGDIPAGDRWTCPADGMPSHDVRLDVTAPTYEAAIVALAAKVRALYGHDRARM